MPALTIRMRVMLMTLLVAFLLVAGWLVGVGGLLATTRSLERTIDHQFDPASALVTEAGKRMDEILGSTRQVARIMFEITLATQEQSSKIEQVNAAVTQMDQFTQQNATLVEHASAAAESLRRQAERLDRALGFFRVSEAALAEHAAPAAAPAALRVPAAAPALGYRS